ncbi:hypothetical protein [Mycolicibacterium aromaticivorans]|nr:hypothetical protein [Mycolicibacterium aromaticivorans]
MNDHSDEYLIPPTMRSDPDTRRRQISQLLHVLAPTAALCVVLTAGPDMMAASPAAWAKGPWNLVLAIGFGVLVWDMRALWLRRRARRAPATLPVHSIGHAFRFAEDALGVRAWPSGRGDYVGHRSAAEIDRDTSGVWASYAVQPLAALACAASQPRKDGAMEWLVHTVTRLSCADSDDAWRDAAHAVAATTDPTMRASFFRTMNMEHRQRQSVALVMRDAVLGVNELVVQR